MEEQLHTQGKSNSLVNKKYNILNTIKDNMNYIYIVLMIIVNILVSLITIEDGKIGLNFPHSVLGWCLWALRMILQTAIGIMILGAFRKQGIKMGHNLIKEDYENYLKATAKVKDYKPRSLKQYLVHYGKKDTFTKALFYIMSGFVVDSVIIGANMNNLISLVLTTISAIAFGISAMVDAEEFVTTELVIWYQQKTAEVTAQKSAEPAKEIEICENANLITKESLEKLETFLDKLSSTEEKM